MTTARELTPRSTIGRMMNAEEVAAEIFSGNVTPHWIRDTLRAGRVRLGHRTTLWEENAVRRWLAKEVAKSDGD